MKLSSSEQAKSPWTEFKGQHEGLVSYVRVIPFGKCPNQGRYKQSGTEAALEERRPEIDSFSN